MACGPVEEMVASEGDETIYCEWRLYGIEDNGEIALVRGHHGRVTACGINARWWRLFKRSNSGF